MQGLTSVNGRRAAGIACAAALGLIAAAPGAAAEPEEYSPGTVIRDCDECPELVVVPAGAFRMGDLTGGGDAGEGPVRTVTIPRPFAAAKHETTFAEWDSCVAAGACRPGVSDIGFGRGERPVMLVSRDDGMAYAGWLSRLTGKPYRLPSEAEWEYVARAGSETKYPWGNDIGRSRANCDECGSEWDDERTSPVGSFPANAFGVHDTVGNVYEWVADCPRETYDGAPSDGTVAGPEGDGDCRWHMMRGGSWVSLPRASRSANRVRNPAGFHDINTGFRVVRSLD